MLTHSIPDGFGLGRTFKLLRFHPPLQSSDPLLSLPLLLPAAMSKSAVKISSDLLSNPLCEQEPSFLEMVTAFDTAMKRMDSFNQEKVNVGLAAEGESRGAAVLLVSAPSSLLFVIVSKMLPTGVSL